MVQFLSKFAKLSLHSQPKLKPFAVLVDDNKKGLYVEEFKKEIKKYPKLKELNLKRVDSIKLSEARETDIIVFGDATGGLKYDYRVVELGDIISTKGFVVFDLVEQYGEVKKALKAYHKANYPKDHKLRQQRSSGRRLLLTTPKQYPKYSYYSKVTGRRVIPDMKIEIPRALLGKYKNIELNIDPGLLPLETSSLLKKTVTGRKKKVSGKQYVVHQNFVKAGLKVYNIYENNKGKEFVNISGRQYLVFRRTKKADFLVEA